MDGLTGRLRTVYAEIVNGSHDLVGLPKYTGHAGCNSLHGSCLWCTQSGKKLAKGTGTCYFGAVRFLRMGHPLRQAYQEVFADTPDNDPRKQAAGRRRPARISDESMEQRMAEAEQIWARAGRRVGQLPAKSGVPDWDNRDKKQYNKVVKELKALGQKIRDAFSSELPYHKPVSMSNYCTPHGVGNKVKDILRCMANQGDKKFKRKYQDIEREHTPGRLTRSRNVRRGHQKFSHLATADSLVKAEELLDTLRLWKGVEVPRDVFTLTHQLKTATCITAAGSIGAYICHIVDLEQSAARCYKDQFFALEHVTLKHYQVGQMHELQEELVEAWTNAEMKQPTFMSTNANHALVHVLPPKVFHLALVSLFSVLAHPLFQLAATNSK